MTSPDQPEDTVPDKTVIQSVSSPKPSSSEADITTKAERCFYLSSVVIRNIWWENGQIRRIVSARLEPEPEIAGVRPTLLQFEGESLQVALEYHIGGSAETDVTFGDFVSCLQNGESTAAVLFPRPGFLTGLEGTELEREIEEHGSLLTWQTGDPNPIYGRAIIEALATPSDGSVCTQG